MPEKITIRLGSLARPLDKAAEDHDTTPSEIVRQALARWLRVDVPDMPRGNPHVGEMAQMAATARWKKKRKG